MSIVETDDKKLTAIGKCALCEARILNSDIYVKLHGLFMCVRHEVTIQVKKTEKTLVDMGKLRLIKLDTGEKLVNPVQDRLTKRIDAHLA